MSKKLTKEEFVEKCNKKFQYKYDYTMSKYISAHVDMDIKCKIHGIFTQTPNTHIRCKIGCPECAKEYNKISKEEFLELSFKKYGKFFDYSKINYLTYGENKILIVCPDHGEFLQTPYNHLQCGCPKCSKRQTTEQVIEKSINKHGEKYDYSKTNYVDYNTKIEINCRIHGVFKQLPSNHYTKGTECPMCYIERTESKSENKIKLFLEKKNIKYIREKRFDDCRNKYPLPFDFYLPELNTCIEFDGEQHFKPIEKFGGEKTFIRTQKHDKIKNKYCLKHNIKLIRIKFNENIKQVLEKNLYEIK